MKHSKLKIFVTTYNNESWVETNIDSILSQTYKNYEVMYIDDNSQDKTFQIAKSIIGEDSRFNLIKHKENMSKAYSFMTYRDDFIDDNDIVLFIDGDDWIPYDDVFENVINHYNSNNCWVAYSKMMCYPSLNITNVQGQDFPEHIHKFNNYRKFDFISSHLKSMKGFIFKEINSKDFKRGEKWIRFADDVALMSSALEISPRDKISIMNFVGYMYNNSEDCAIRTNSDFNKGRLDENYVRTIRPYSVKRNNSDRYVSPRILGRLANQMFEIAAAYSFAIDNDCNLVVSTNNGIYKSLLGEDGNPLNYKENIFRNVDFNNNISNFDIWKEPSFLYTPISYKFEKNLYLEGHFQSEKYFKHNKEKILSFFKCPAKTKKYILSKYSKYLNEENVSIHIRRGDYLVASDHHPSCTVEYYRESINKYFDSTKYILVFSDDIPWTKTVFKGDKYIFIENEEDYVDMYLMSMCKNNIIANSTFSWWGAWLNTNPDKIVIAPKIWFGPANQSDTTDLIPKEWIRI